MCSRAWRTADMGRCVNGPLAIAVDGHAATSRQSTAKAAAQLSATEPAGRAARCCHANHGPGTTKPRQSCSHAVAGDQHRIMETYW